MSKQRHYPKKKPMTPLAALPAVTPTKHKRAFAFPGFVKPLKPSHRWHEGPMARERERPRGQRLRPCKTPYIQIETSWTPDTVLTARDSHLQGQFQTSGMLWVWMLCTSRLKIAIRKRVGALSSLLLVVEPASGAKTGTPIEKAVAKLWESEQINIMPEALRQGIQRQAIGMGASLCRVHWVDDEVGRWWPRLTLWADDAFYYNDQECCYYARTREGADKKVKPGNGWFLYLPDGEKGFQLGAVVSLGMECLLATMAKGDWAVFNKSAASIVKKAIVPRGAVTSVKNDFFDQVEGVGEGTNSTVLCGVNQDGSKFDFTYESVPMTQVDTFERSQQSAEKTITIEILGQEKSTDLGTEGARSAVEALQGVEDRIILNDGESLSTAMHNQLAVPWCVYNFNHPEWAPWVRWREHEGNQSGEKADSDKKVAEASVSIESALQGTDKQLDKVAYFETANIPMMQRPPSQVPAASNALDLFQSEGLLGSLRETLDGTEYAVDMAAVLQQYGIPYVKVALPPPAPIPELGREPQFPTG